MAVIFVNLKALSEFTRGRWLLCTHLKWYDHRTSTNVSVRQYKYFSQQHLNVINHVVSKHMHRTLNPNLYINWKTKSVWRGWIYDNKNTNITCRAITEYLICLLLNKALYVFLTQPYIYAQNKTDIINVIKSYK